MPKSKFKWNARAGRYTLGGKFVKQSAIRGALDKALASTALRARELSLLLQAGGVSLIEWERLMRALVKDTQLYSAALARGGWAQMRASDYGRVGAAVKKQYTYLNRFASELGTGAPLNGSFVMRASMYMSAGRHTYYQLHDRMQEELGMTEERNVLHPADHCNGCLEADALGWVPIGELPQIGNRDCLVNCKCDKEYR